MKKSITNINPKGKKQEKKVPKYPKYLIIIQLILTITVIAFGIITLFKNELVYIFELILGITLIDMGINNHLIYKRNKLTILYFLIGLGAAVIAILKIIGL